MGAVEKRIQMAGRGRANSIDVRVGNRLRLRRTAIGVSQEELGRRLDLTFQQIQKFESGSNRISASYLFEIANALHVPVSYFFEDADKPDHLAKLSKPMQKFLMTGEGLALWRAFTRIPDDKLRQKVLDLVKAMAETSTGRRH
jgi:transcriptional regulator with XRE-family HTH domain